MVLFKLIKHKFLNQTLLHIHLYSFQFEHGSVQLRFNGISTFVGYLMPKLRGAFNKFPDFFCTGI